MEEGSQEEKVREPSSFRAREVPDKDVVPGRYCRELGNDQTPTQVTSRGPMILCQQLTVSCS